LRATGRGGGLLSLVGGHHRHRPAAHPACAEVLPVANPPHHEAVTMSLLPGALSTSSIPAIFMAPARQDTPRTQRHHGRADLSPLSAAVPVRILQLLQAGLDSSWDVGGALPPEWRRGSADADPAPPGPSTASAAARARQSLARDPAAGRRTPTRSLPHLARSPTLNRFERILQP
jgi:hypothetical protein